MTILRIRLVVLANSVFHVRSIARSPPLTIHAPSFGRVLNSAGGATEHSCLAVVLAHCENSVLTSEQQTPPLSERNEAERCTEARDDLVRRIVQVPPPELTLNR